MAALTEARSEGSELNAFDVRTAYPGKGLLTNQWEQGADAAVLALRAAYKNVAEEKAENVIFWDRTRKTLRDAFASRMLVTGLTHARIDLDVLFDRFAPEHWTGDPSGHVKLVRALFRDYTDTFWGHIEDRLNTDANIHLEFVGGTGSGKSSCAITVADWMKRIEPDRLLDHLNFDLGELQDKLKTKKPRETVIQDEFLAQSGEGARTVTNLFSNIEDTLRASQVSLFTCSPRMHEHATMQARLEAILYNRRDHFTLFLVWRDDRPLGVVAIPWCREELYEKYRSFKAANVERSLSGAFQDRAWIIRNACRCFDDENFVDYLRTMVKGRQFTKSDFERAIRVHRGDVMAASQREGVAAFMVEMVSAYKRASPKFRKWFGIEPPNGLRVLAGKASQEEKPDGEEDGQ